MSANSGDKDSAQKCPYCFSTEGCIHLLLVVDLTFRIGEGGTLMDEFNARWNRLSQIGPSANISDPFQGLLDDVSALSDTCARFSFEGGPGMSSAYAAYYVKSRSQSTDAVTKFTSKDTP